MQYTLSYVESNTRAFKAEKRSNLLQANSTMWAFKAEKGSEFIAAHQPGPYGQQRFAENDRVFIAEKGSEDMHCGWYFFKDAQNYYQIDIE